MGRPMTTATRSRAPRQDTQQRALLIKALDAVAAGQPADDAAAQAALTAAINDAATATGQGALAAQLLSLPALPIVWVNGLEVTQSVQDMGQSVPLAAGKATIVRAYLAYPPKPVKVRGELFVARSPFGPWTRVASLGPAQLDPSRSGSSLAALQSRRRNLGFSLNFRLPDAFTGAGDLWILLGRVRNTSGHRLPLFSFFPKKITFRAAPPLRLRLVRVRYPMGNPAIVHEPTATDQANIASWLKRAYPVADVQMSVTTVNANATAPFQAGTLNAQLAALRAQDLASGTDGRTHYYGLVSDAGFFMRGLASGIPSTPHPSTVASGPTGGGTWGWDSDGSYGDWYTGHELGHTFGRFHAEFCGAAGGAPYPFTDGQLANADEAFEGLDVGDPALGFPMAVMPGTEWHDVMTYCSKQWLSSFTYTGIFDRLVAEDALGPGTTAGAAAPARAAGATRAAGRPGAAPVADGVVHVVATVNVTARTGQLASVLPLPGGAAHAPAGVADKKDRRIEVRVLDGGGAVLTTVPAPFLPDACLLPGEDLTGLVDITVPNVAGAASVELVMAGKVLDRFAATAARAAAPTVATGPSRSPRARAGAAPGASGHPVTTVSWASPGAPAGQRYVVQVSADGGATWSTVAAGTADTSIGLDAADYGGATEVDVRITATTGFGEPGVVTQHVQLG